MRVPERLMPPDWLWALLPLLLAAVLTMPLLDVDAFNGDEPKSIAVAGAPPDGPFSPGEIWHQVEQKSPEQALGWPMLLSLWGRLVGWSEPVMRVPACFAGLLTLAWLYRTGRDLFAPPAGLAASLLLAASVFFLAYMIHARAFTLVALCTTLCVWSWWRVTQWRGTAGPWARIALVAGTAGLLWSHYVASLFLPALALVHLFCARRGRRWWQGVYLLAAGALLAMPQLPLFLRGLARTAGKEDLHSRALSAPALVTQVLRHLGNGLSDLTNAPELVIVPALTLLLVMSAWLYRRAGARDGAGMLLALVALTLLLLMILVNAAFRLIVDNRIRYLMPLWPLMALLAGAAVWRPGSRHRHVTTALAALWLLAGTWLMLATDYRYETGYFFRSDLNRYYARLREQIPPSDFLLLDLPAAKLDGRRYYTRNLGRAWATIERESPDPWATIRSVHPEHPWLWLLYLPEHHGVRSEVERELNRVFCERVMDEVVVDTQRLALERYALPPPENCPELPLRLAFNRDIHMAAPTITLDAGLLRLETHLRSADTQLLADYSLALHLIDPRSGQRVAQSDTAIGPGATEPLRGEIDVSALPAGEYELHVALYEWRSGTRLPARDLVTGESGDMLVLQNIRFEP